MTRMKIEHISVWVKDLEMVKDFYIKYFNMSCSDKYINPKKQFTSYFLSFTEGSRIEIMHRPEIATEATERGITMGLTHFAISVGSKTKVDQLTDELRNDGYEIVGEPRTTGDGYYESVVLDPEGNNVDITE